MANLNAPAPHGKSSVFALNVQFKHLNSSSIEEFLNSSVQQLGRKDLSRPLALLQKQWVRDVGDLRLLIQEGQLRTIGLPLRLCTWIEEELARVQGVNNAIQSAFSEVKQASQGFEYKFDMDTNGILYYLGTQGHSKPWTNPHVAGVVKASSSGQLHDSVGIEALVGRDSVRNVTKSNINAWMQVDLLDKYAIVTNYTLRHYSSWDTECVRHWVFEGSNDGKDFTVLREHKNDASINGVGATHTFAVNAPPVPYRIFRVRITGANSNNHNYLACSGIELYGTLMDEAEAQNKMKNFDAEAKVAPAAEEKNVKTFMPSGIAGDENGIVHYLGTKGGTIPFTNPMTTGDLKVSASSLMHDSAPASSVVGKALVRCVTKATPNSFFIIDFLRNKIAPTHYMLRHYASWDTEAIRSWRFEGSNDMNTWTTLTEHQNDQSLKLKGQMCVWRIPPMYSQKYFRAFRVFQTGMNSNQHFYLALSGFEIYGKLKASDEVAEFKGLQPLELKEPMEFKHVSDFDGNGIVEYIATQGKTQPWINPATAGLLNVTASSVMQDSEPISHVVGREVVRCVTKPHANSWFCIDFLDKYVIPTAYTLRHYATWDVEALRNWNFEGSLDGNTWDVLRRHVDDPALAAKGATHTFTLPKTRKCYRMFRILQWGPNSNKHNYLALSGFDMYGTLLPEPVEVEEDVNNMAVELEWDAHKCSKFIRLSGNVAENSGSNDKWQLVRSSKVLQGPGKQRVACKIVRDSPTTNTWAFIVGVIPVAYPTSGKEWVGAYDSWGYIAGTGGKCHSVAKSRNYGVTYGEGDIIGILMDFDRSEIEFFKNGTSQGVAYADLSGPVNLACSFTGTGSRVKALADFKEISIGAGFDVSPWDQEQKVKYIVVDPRTGIVTNRGYKNKWQSIRTTKSFRKGVQQFSVQVISAPKTPNSWQFIVGVVRPDFPLTWVGASRSWGYIAGTGGKCFDVGASNPYGAKWGANLDIITVRMDFRAGTIEFFKNGISQGVAFENLEGTVYGAISMTAAGAQIRYLPDEDQPVLID